MDMEFKTACAGMVMLVAMGWAQTAHAQHSPWWERQKLAQSAAETGSGQTRTQAAATPAHAPQYPAYAPAVSREKIEAPAYSWIEAGAARLDVDVYDVKEHANGAYVRGSVAVTDDIYVFGGYDRVSKTWGLDSERFKLAFDQAEIGVGSKVSLTERTDFISELSLLRLGAKLDYKDHDYPEDNFSGRDHLYAGKAMLGFRGRPVSNLELWAKAGYLWVDNNLLVDDSFVGNIGIQYRFTPIWGLVGEAEFYEDVRLYRLGVRASF